MPFTTETSCVTDAILIGHFIYNIFKHTSQYRESTKEIISKMHLQKENKKKLLTVKMQTTKETMMNDKPYLVKFHERILVSL